MKTSILKSKVSYALILLAGTAIAISCKKNNSNADVQSQNQTAQLSKDEEIAIAKAGFSPSNAYKKDGGYVVEGDIFLDAKNLAIQQGIVADLIKNKPSTEQYRTTNIVNVGTSRELKIKIDAGASQTVFTNAAVEAVKRYNDLNLKLSLKLLDATSTETADIVINGADLGKTPSGQTILGQSAGFPTDGNPASPIKLSNVVYNSTYNNNNLLATVIAHEIGHAIGFRHTDFADRNFSCDGATYNAWYSFLFKQNEGQAGVGAIQIPGTPQAENGDPNSWMLACSDGSNRPFTAYDIVALKALYPVK